MSKDGDFNIEGYLDEDYMATGEQLMHDYFNPDGTSKERGITVTYDTAVDILKKEGRYIYTEDELLGMIDDKIPETKTRNVYYADIKRKQLADDLKVMSGEQMLDWLENADIKQIDEIDNLIDERLVPNLVSKMDELRTCYDEFEYLRSENVDKLRGYYAEVNKVVFAAASDDVDKVYKYMLESTLPALNRIIRLKEIAKELHEIENSIDFQNSEKKFHESRLPKSADYYFVGEQYYDMQKLEYVNSENGGYIDMSETRRQEEFADIKKIEEIIKGLEERRKELLDEAKQIVKEIKEFEELRLTFIDIVE